MSTSTRGKTRKSYRDYSFLDQQTQSDPYEFYDKLHHECPVYHMPETGMYMVTKYEDLRQVLKDTVAFSSDSRNATAAGLQPPGLMEKYHSALADRGWSHVQTLQRTDPPEHSRYRRLLDRVFTGKRVRAMAGYVDGVAAELVDAFIDAGECEFIADFAMPMPGIIIAEQLGLGRADILTFKKWADAMLATATIPMNEEQIMATLEIELEAQHFLADVFEDRRKNPTDDLISGMVHAHSEGEDPLSMHELQNLMHQLITGGYETTQSALAHGMWLLVRQPELQGVLRDNPEKMKTFVEESLRWESPVQGLGRMATRDIELNGTTIPKNSPVIVRYGAANRDEEIFECPHNFDIDRKNAGSHLAFGSGAHFCVGAMLARQEMVSSFTAIINRMSRVELARPMTDPAHEPSLFFLPIKEMHLKFDKL
jgi:cytochrome P450